MMKQTNSATITTTISVKREDSVFCVIAVLVVRGVIDGVCGMVTEKCVVVEKVMLEWSASFKLDVVTSMTSISVVLGLRVTCTASLAARLAVSVNSLMSSVSLTSESK